MNHRLTAEQLAALDAALKRHFPEMRAITYEHEMLKVCLAIDGAPAHRIMYALGRVTGAGLFDIGLIVDHEYVIVDDDGGDTVVYFPHIAVEVADDEAE